MTTRIIHLTLFMLLTLSVKATTEPVEGLIRRLLPGQENNFILSQETTSDGADYFEISSENGKIKIQGNSPVSIASGLNWFLKYYCNCSFSFCEDQDKLPKKLPILPKPVRKTTRMKHNFYMNYCTFSYTTAFWDWSRWEREIDLMALNGVTTPMAMVGVEAVWRNTLREFNFTDREIKEFLCGPAYFGWLLMGNLEKHGGPLPDEWFDRQIELQKKILERMREYGMRPVFQGFFGMVPEALRTKYPEAKIIDQGQWLGFNRPPVLLSSDPLFEQMAKVWYHEYEHLFGKTDFFGGDLFHEGGKTEGIPVAKVASEVQKNMLRYNPKAQWIIQAWGANPRNELLAGLDRNHTIIVDLSAEYWTRWKDRKGFNGFPWIWCHVTNYGGNIGLHGRLDAIAQGVLDGQTDSVASKCMVGIGAVPEGIEVNPVAFDLGNEMRWRQERIDMTQWIKKYADRRYGRKDQTLEAAWNIFYKTAYGTFQGHRRPSESVFCAKPSLKGKRITASAWSQCKTFYDTDLYASGVALFLSRSSQYKKRKTYQYDAVDFVRQYLSDLGRKTYYELVEAYQKQNQDRFEEKRKLFLELILDQDQLLSAHPYFNVGRWLKQARTASAIREIQDLYEFNARQLIGTWSEENTDLRDYAHREWGGMLKDYYYPRWDAYLQFLSDQLQGKKVKEPDLYPAERKWIESHNEYPIKDINVLTLAKKIFEKYYVRNKN